MADGRPNVIVVTGPAWLIVAGLTAHEVKDLWQHRTRYVAKPSSAMAAE